MMSIFLEILMYGCTRHQSMALENSESSLNIEDDMRSLSAFDLREVNRRTWPKGNLLRRIENEIHNRNLNQRRNKQFSSLPHHYRPFQNDINNATGVINTAEFRNRADLMLAWFKAFNDEQKNCILREFLVSNVFQIFLKYITLYCHWAGGQKTVQWPIVFLPP